MLSSRLPQLPLLLTLLALLGGLLAVSEGPAAAADECSIIVPSRLVVDAPSERVTGRLDSDCAQAGEDWASWGIWQADYVPKNAFFFDTGRTTDVWRFHSWDYLGRYHVDGGIAYDDRATRLTQNEATVFVRLRSRVSLTARRSGRYLRLRAAVTRYRPGPARFGGWPHRSVTVTYRRCAGCAWHHLRTRRTGPRGRAVVRVYAPRVKDLRAGVGSSASTWGSVSAAIHR